MKPIREVSPAIYGLHAMAGVINIVTRSPSAHPRITVGHGTFKQGDGAASHVDRVTGAQGGRAADVVGSAA